MRAIRGQLVDVRAGATATKGGSRESEMKLWQVNPTGSPPSMPVTMVTPVANRLMASLKLVAVEGHGQALPRVIDVPSAAAFTST